MIKESKMQTKKYLTKRAKRKDDIDHSQGSPEECQPCQNLTRTSAAKSGQLYDVVRENGFEMLHFSLKRGTLENLENPKWYAKIMEGFDTFPLCCRIRAYINSTIPGGLQI